MDKDKIVSAFDKFVDDRYAESEDDLRSEIRSAVNDHLKDKLSLEKNPVEGVEDDENDTNQDDDGDQDE